MKTKHKALLLSLCAVALVVGSVFGTMAYLTSSDQVVNTFTVGNVSIKLDEAKTNENGDGTLVPNADRVKANYYHLLPGHTYNKDPMVTVLKGSERSYIKLLVTVTKSKELDAIFAAHPGDDAFTMNSIFKGYDADNWLYKGNTEDTTANTRTYEFWYKDTVAAPDADVALDALFDQIVVPKAITGAELATLVKTEKADDGTDKIVSQLTITAVAHAIQADGFANAEAAWAAYTNP